MTRRTADIWGLAFLKSARGRSIVVTLSAIVTLTALFVEGFPSAPWLVINKNNSTRAAMVPNRVVPGHVTVTFPKPRGNDSSISSLPLPLILVSTRLGSNNREGFAEIGVDAGSPQTYAAGAVLANGARLAEVYADHVVLERDGKSVDLYLQGHGRSATPPELAALLEVGGIKSVPSAVQVVDPLTAVLRPSPVFKGTALAGFEVYPGRDEGIFLTLGFQPGDIIVSIDNVAVTNAEKSISQLRSLTQGSALSVTIRRGRALMSISLDGSVLLSARHQEEAKTTHRSEMSTST